MFKMCNYKNIFGKPKRGIHKYRFLNLAIIDVIFTIIGAFIISYFFKLNFIFTTFSLLILAIIFHRLFCVRTTIDKLLFPNL